MSGHQNISEHFLSAREKSLEKKVVHLETQLQVYKSQIDILHEEHKKLEERVLTMESALTKTKKELLETKKEVLDKELAEIQLSEELKSMTLQAEKYKRLFSAERNKNTCGLDKLEALISNANAEMHIEDMPNRFESFKDLISVIQEGFQAQIKMILDKLSDAEDMLYRSSPYTEGKVQQTKINKETPSNGSMFELANLSDKVKGEGDDEPRVKAANPLPEKIQAVTDSSEACKHEQFSCNSTKGEDSVESEPTPVVLFQQTQQSFVQAQANFKHAHPNDTIDWHPFMSKSPIKGAKKQDLDCILIYESRTPIADREMASRLFLPSNFYNYTKREPCPGCIGCRGIPKRAADTIKQEVKDTKQVSTSATSAVFTSTATSHVFGQSANFGQLTLSSFKAQDGIAFSQSQTKTSHKPFQGAEQQLFAEPAEEVKGRDSDKLHFEPVIPLPEEIQVVTGEEGLEMMFSERAKLYRFDGDSSQWKERGIGEVKLLRHPTSGRGIVLMRRDQIKKLCANHNITAEMELKPNVGSDRSWVWYTSADYAEGEGKSEKLAIKFKTAETAGNFKRVFDELKELFSSGHLPEKATAENQKATGCELYKQFLSNFAHAPGTWSCEVCYVENKAEESTCVACNSLKPNDEETEPLSKHGEEIATANVSAVDSVEPKTFQNLNKEASTSFFFQPPGGTGAPYNFTFRMTVSPGSPPQKPRSPLSHSTPTSPVRGDDDGPYFEPLIPLPDKVECRTGEEGQEVLFCDRCKLFRYDSDTSQWKERGVGDIKILLNPSSKRHRILMRREHVFKICANHVITSEMQLNPFPKSERAWLWTTLGDFSEETTTAETLAVRFKCNEVANNFKEVFDKALQTLSHKSDHWVSSSNAKDNHLDKAIVKKDQKERDVFGYEEEAFAQPGISASGEGQSTEIPEVTTSAPSIPSQSGFLFGSASVPSLSFQCVAASSLTASPFGKKTLDKSPGLKGAGHGSQLFANNKTKDDSEEVEADGNHPDGPHFEPIIPLPDKIDVKTGEEDEEVMFSHRSKLYRFVAEEKQWKERGIGYIKLLRNARSGKMRVLMRRDQVLKLCANHQITTDMNLQPNAGSDRSWVWSTHADFSEGKCKAERLAVRFKNEDIARQFREKFEECQEMLKNQASLKPPLQKETVNKEGVKEDLLAKFKAEEGSWECDTCMVRNGSDKLVCAACTSPKPGITDSQEKKAEGKPIFGSGSTSSGTGFTFGSGASSSGTGFSFGSGATLCRKGFVFGSSGTNKGGAKPFFSFGSSNLTPSSSSETSTTFGSMTQLKTTVQEHVSGDYTDVSQTDQQTPDVDNKQPRNGEKNNVLTADTDAVEGERVEMTSFGESKTPPNNKNDDSSEEKAFLFGSPSISAMSFQSVAASSIENSPFGQNA